jgi:mono/diheme cytochrome c family protein
MRMRTGLVFGVTIALGCGGGHVELPQLQPATLGDTTGLLARGEYIVRNVAVCGQCHAADPQAPDGPLSGGFAFRNWRLGTIRAANLTPDTLTGIGRWTEAEIIRALRSGEDRTGHLVAPVMPYEWFRAMSDRDALAVARYLKSQPPVVNIVKSDGNLVYALAKFFMLGPKRAGQVVGPPVGATEEYGRYLAHHVALCADCHTPRTGLQQKPDHDKLFAGTADPPSGFPANPRNLTFDPETGIGSWTELGFLNTIRNGVNPRGDSLHAFMPWRQLRRMNEDDLRAIYRYLKTLPPIHNSIPKRGGGTQ